MLMALAGISLVRGLLPAGLALFARGLINAASAMIHAGEHNISPLLPWLVFGFGVALLEAVNHQLNNLLINRLRDKINASLTVDILRHASSQPLAFFETPRLRDMISQARTGATGQVSEFIRMAQSTMTQTFQSLSLIAVLVYVEPLVILVLGPVSIPFIFYQWKLSKKRHRLEMDRTTKRRRSEYLTNLLMEPSSVAEIKQLGIAPHLIKTFEEFVKEFISKDWKLARMNFRSLALYSLLIVLGFFAVLFRVAMQTLIGGATLGDLAIFGGSAVRLRVSLERAITSGTSAMEKILFVTNLITFLERDDGEQISGSGDVPRSEGEVEFRKVCFSYPGQKEQVLSDFSLHVRPGETLAVVGRNGAGKTTLVKVLTGLYRPVSGKILINGVDMRTLSEEAVRGTFSTVMQHFGRYEASIRDNIAYGEWEGLKERPDLVREIAEKARVTQIVDKLPHGFDTRLGRSFGDHDLSGGEWQMIAIARALARDASILILDEPTSNLDAKAELALFKQFLDLARHRTTILISHRFSTISMADRIAVLDGGRIIEEGTHSQLMAEGGQYKDLYRMHYKWMTGGGSPDDGER
jgi:ATP-binding cassette subfamily B protein